MAEVTGTVEVAMNPNKYGKFSILVNEKWYNTNPEWIVNKPVKGDTVIFDDGGKTYIKNLRITGGSHGHSPAPAKAATGGYSTLGVELGHAANIATQMAINSFTASEMGSTEYYDFFVTHTEKVFEIMSALKYKHTHKVELPKATVLAPVATDDVADIFK